VILFFEAVAILLVVGALIATFLWMLADAVGCFDERRDRVRPYTRDV
jgi:hypothetical protein